MRKSDGVRVDHEKKRHRAKFHHEKKSDGVGFDHKKKTMG